MNYIMKKFVLWSVAICFAVAPMFADARAGSTYSSSRSSSSSRSYSYSSPARSYTYSNSSVGSKGSNTYKSSPTYQPITKSSIPVTTSVTTPRPTSVTPTPVPAPVSTYAAPTAPAYVAPITSHSSGGFWSSFAGGAAGAAVSNMMMNHGNGATIVNGGAVGAPMVVGGGSQPVYEYSQPSNSFSGFLSFILIIFVLMLIAYGIYKFMTREKGPDAHYSGATAKEIEQWRDMSIKDVSQSSVTKSDREQFKQLVTRIQRAWSSRNGYTLKTATTAEMYEHFMSAISSNIRQGVINRVENVTDVECDVLEVWEETSGKYATCIMRWKAHDFTTDLHGKVLDEGSNEYERETWTFIKTGSDAWVLSAVQQMED